jgi:hypothetical protein
MPSGLGIRSVASSIVVVIGILSNVYDRYGGENSTIAGEEAKRIFLNFSFRLRLIIDGCVCPYFSCRSVSQLCDHSHQMT